MPGLSALLVDDDDFVRSTVSQQLRGAGVERIVTAADGSLALRAVQREGPFDLIVSDLMLPGVDGIEMLRGLAGRQPATAVVLISALDEAVLRAAAVLARQRGLRALGALRKPIRQEALVQVVRSLSRMRPTEGSGPPAVSADALQRALERGEILLRALPQRRLHDERLGGAELQLHWRAPGGDAIGSERLFLAARRAGLLSRLTDYLLSRAVQTGADWWAEGLRVPIGLSLPAEALERLDLPDLVGGLLRTHKLLPQQLRLGFTESAIVGDEQALDVLTRLRMRDIGVRIDDFGGSHHGFMQIQRLPATQVRIDAHLLQLGSTGERLLSHLLQTAAALDFESLADGVEDAGQREHLARGGCTLAQGPHIDAAVDIADMVGEVVRA